MFSKVKIKLLRLGTILGLAIVLSVVFGVVLLLIEDFLPIRIQEILLLLLGGDWMNASLQFKSIYASFGDQGKLCFVLLQFAQTFLAPIPGQVTAFLGGYIFGFSEGLWLTMLGVTIGVFFSILSSRLFGRFIIERFVSQRLLDKFDYLLKSESLWDFFLIFLLPGFPDDAVCFVAGITRISIWKLIIIAVVGRLPGTIPLVLAGATVTTAPVWTNIVLSLGLIIALLGWLFDDEIRTRVNRLSIMIWNRQ